MGSLHATKSNLCPPQLDRLKEIIPSANDKLLTALLEAVARGPKQINQVLQKAHRSGMSDVPIKIVPGRADEVCRLLKEKEASVPDNLSPLALPSLPKVAPRFTIIASPHKNSLDADLLNERLTRVLTNYEASAPILIISERAHVVGAPQELSPLVHELQNRFKFAPQAAYEEVKKFLNGENCRAGTFFKEKWELLLKMDADILPLQPFSRKAINNMTAAKENFLEYTFRLKDHLVAQRIAGWDLFNVLEAPPFDSWRCNLAGDAVRQQARDEFLQGTNYSSVVSDWAQGIALHRWGNAWREHAIAELVASYEHDFPQRILIVGSGHAGALSTLCGGKAEMELLTSHSGRSSSLAGWPAIAGHPIQLSVQLLLPTSEQALKDLMRSFMNHLELMVANGKAAINVIRDVVEALRSDQLSEMHSYLNTSDSSTPVFRRALIALTLYTDSEKREAVISALNALG